MDNPNPGRGWSWGGVCATPVSDACIMLGLAPATLQLVLQIFVELEPLLFWKRFPDFWVLFVLFLCCFSEFGFDTGSSSSFEM